MDAKKGFSKRKENREIDKAKKIRQEDLAFRYKQHENQS